MGVTQEELSLAHAEELKDARGKLKVLEDKFKNNKAEWTYDDYYAAKRLRKKISDIEGIFRHGILFRK